MNSQRCQGSAAPDRMHNLQDSDVHGEVCLCLCSKSLFDPRILLNKRNLPSGLRPGNGGLPHEQLTAAYPIAQSTTQQMEQNNEKP